MGTGLESVKDSAPSVYANTIFTSTDPYSTSSVAIGYATHVYTSGKTLPTSDCVPALCDAVSCDVPQLQLSRFTP